MGRNPGPKQSATSGPCPDSHSHPHPIAPSTSIVRDADASSRFQSGCATFQQSLDIENPQRPSARRRFAGRREDSAAPDEVRPQVDSQSNSNRTTKKAEAELSSLLGGATRKRGRRVKKRKATTKRKGRRKMSAAARKRIGDAARKRWAAFRKGKKGKPKAQRKPGRDEECLRHDARRSAR